MLKAGTQTGSLVNHLHSRAVRGQPDPEVGMGATILGWTDRHAGTIIEVINGKQVIIKVQQDDAKRTDANGLSENQTYEYSRNPDGPIYCFRQTKEGFWQSVRFNKETGRWNKVEGGGVRIGERQKYWDPHF